MTTLEALQNTLASIVAIVDQQGEVHGRVRLQKLGYLLQQSGFAPIRATRFAYHHYGPYSEQLAGALDQAVASGLIEEERRDQPSGRKLYAYKLRREHPDYEYLKLSPADQDVVRKFMSTGKGAHWRALELTATVVYLERNTKREGVISREAAITRALGLKPDCKPYREAAETLLAELGFGP